MHDVVDVLIKHAQESGLFIFQQGLDDEFLVVRIKEEAATLTLAFSRLEDLVSVFEDR